MSWWQALVERVTNWIATPIDYGYQFEYSNLDRMGGLGMEFLTERGAEADGGFGQEYLTEGPADDEDDAYPHW